MDIAEIRKRAKQLRFMEGDEVEGRGGVTPPLQQPEEAALPDLNIEAPPEEPALNSYDGTSKFTSLSAYENQPPHPTPLHGGGEPIAAKPIAMGREIFTEEPEMPPLAVPASQESEAIIEESKEASTEQGKEEAAKEVVETITFLLDKEEYALDIRLVKEIIKPRELTDVPRAPKDIMGVISLRGAVIPIMNLRGRLGMPMKEGGERIIIVRDGTSLLGLIVDNVKHVVRVPKNNIEPPPSVNNIDGEFIKGIGRYKGEMFILLELEKILESM